MKKILLITILFAALFLRIWGLDKVPPELFGDELDVGYHAYSLLHTGRDYYGQLLPTYIHSFSEWRAPLLMYVTAPFVGIFGLNEWGVRLPSAVFGVLGIYLLYLLLLELTIFNKKETASGLAWRGNWKLAIIASLLLAISPWHLQYSRAAFEVSLLLFLLLAGVFSFLKGLKRAPLLYLSAFLFGLTFYTYSTANVFTPLLILILVITNSNTLKKLNLKSLLAPILLFIVVALPFVFQVFFGNAAERFGKFSVFSDQELVAEIISSREEGGGGLIEIISHNKPIYWTKNIINNYATSFSPQFLFIEGDFTFRHSVHELGQIYWIMLPFIFWGLFIIFKEKDKNGLFWLLWLLAAPIPASLTVDGARHATRLFLMLPPLMVIAAIGANRLWEIKGSYRNLIVGASVVLVLIEFLLYSHRYWVHYPQESWRWWHVGYKEAMQFVDKIDEDYELVFINNTYEPALIRFLFWSGYQPDELIKDFSIDQDSDVYPNFTGFVLGGKYHFGTAKDTVGVDNFIRENGNILYLVSHRDEVGGDWDWEKDTPRDLKVMKTVRNPYNEPVFYVVTSEKGD